LSGQITELELRLAIGDQGLYSEQKEKYNAGITIIRRVDSHLRRCQLGRMESLPGGAEMSYELAWKVLVGILAGGLARYALPGRNPGGLVVSVMVGMAGSFLAAYLGDRYGWYRQGEFEGILGCTAGSIVLLAIFRFLSGTTKEAGGRENYDL
jgi:uncharacterized membrane protein YeaQ/YmgE (transglycosylase-associated protein family)